MQKERAPLHHPKGIAAARKRPQTANEGPPSGKKRKSSKKQKERDPSPYSYYPDPSDVVPDPKDLVDQQLSKIEDRLDERDPKLYVDVNIGKTGTERHMERIVVYEGDTADSLAAEFCAKHNLNEDMRQKLKALLEQQIAGVLPKIMEDDDADDSDEDNQYEGDDL